MPSKLQVPSSVLMFFGAGCAIALGFWLVIENQTTMLSAFGALAVLALAFRRSRTLGIYLALVFLITLGDIRRISSLLNGFSANDPLILVGPVFVALVTVPLFLRLRLQDTPSKLVLALLVLMVLEIFNPAQGGIVIGAAGALFWLPPLLWFWVGRSFGSEAVIRTIVYRILIPCTLLASMLGMYQTFVGPAPWQKAWIEHAISIHFNVVQIGHGGVRSFGFSTATSEYTALLLMASLFCLIGALAGRRVLYLPLLVLLPTLFLASERNAILRLLIGGVIGYAFKSRNVRTLGVRMAFAIVVAFGGLALALSQHGDVAESNRDSTAHAEVAHQVNGLAHPFDVRRSTGGAHAAEIFRAFVSTFKHPIGFGTGSASLTLSRFSTGGSQLISEFDITDTFLNLGLPGGLVFLSLIVSMIFMGYRYTRFGPKDISLALFGMMFAFIGSWVSPGEYGNGPVFFMLLGSMVRIVHKAEQSQATQLLAQAAVPRTRRPQLSQPIIARVNGA